MKGCITEMEDITYCHRNISRVVPVVDSYMLKKTSFVRDQKTKESLKKTDPPTTIYAFELNIGWVDEVAADLLQLVVAAVFVICSMDHLDSSPEAVTICYNHLERHSHTGFLVFLG